MCVQCHMFQHRLSCMLASLTEQINLKPDQHLYVDVAYTLDNGKPTTKEILNLYKNDLNIIPRQYPNITERFQYRGYVRNDQLRECKTEWILFADSDMVYNPSYFAVLLNRLNYEYDEYSKAFISAGRFSTELESTQTRMSELMGYTNGFVEKVQNPYDRFMTLPGKLKSNVGAGYFQLINLDKCPDSCYYIEEGTSKDGEWYSQSEKKTKGQKARSDQQFRRRIKKSAKHIKLPKWYAENQIHIQHIRDNEVGYHLETQR